MSEHLFYSGIIRHRRFEPGDHAFTYKLFMLSLDLDKVDTLFSAWPFVSLNKPALGWFRRRDYIGCSTIPIKQHVLDQVEEKLGFRPNGKVTLLTHLRMWGVLMNPIAIFCCHDHQGQLQAVVLQVTNTPWGEQCLYVLQADPNSDKQSFVFDKSMHVSPFHPMQMTYVCRYVKHQKKMVFHLENHQKQTRVTDATLIMRAQPLTRKKLIQSVFLYPYMTSKVFYGIYKQAFCLYLKKNPIYTNPTTDCVKKEKLNKGHLVK